MKRKLQGIFILLLVGTIATNAQPIITAAGFNPVIGDKFKLQATKEIIANPSSFNGSNQVWDFSNLVDSNVVYSYSIVSPQGLAFADSFPTSNIAYYSYGSSIEFDRVDSTGWGQVGYAYFDSNQNRYSGLDKYTPKYPYMVYPIRANASKFYQRR